MKKSFITSKTERLDKFLAEKYPSFSRAYLKEQVRAGNILINGKKVKPGFLLRESDRVGFAPNFNLPESAKLIPNPAIKLNIIYEDTDVLVLDKPAGLTVHPRQKKNGSPLESEIDSTLVSGLLAYYPALANVGDFITSPCPSPSKGEGEKEGVIYPLLRPGIVHRLDKDTSGVLIVAKNQPSFDWLKNQFKERLAQKKYLALVRGLPKDNKGEIKTLLARSQSDPTKQKVVTNFPPLERRGRVDFLDAEKNPSPRYAEGSGEASQPPFLKGGVKSKIREAITQYQVLKQFKNFSLLEVSPKTGRLHQIRAHLAWLGHPVIGDTKYGSGLRQGYGRQGKKQLLPQGLKRQFLHATELKITLPGGQEKTFISPLPDELNQIVQCLEKNHNL